MRAKKDAEHCRQVSASYLTPFEVPSSLINTIVVDCRKCLSAEQSNSPLKPACNQLFFYQGLSMSTFGERAFGRVGGEDVVEYSLANER